VYPGSVTRKGFFASIISAFVGARVAPAKTLSFKAGDLIAVDFAPLPIGSPRLVSNFAKLQRKYVFRAPDLRDYPPPKYAGVKVFYRTDKVGA